jgi:hypothetical protein
MKVGRYLHQIKEHKALRKAKRRAELKEQMWFPKEMPQKLQERRGD